MPLQRCEAPSLYTYQQDVVDRVKAAIAALILRLCIVMATGSGKTRTATALIYEAQGAGKRVLVLVHRRELVLQFSRALHAVGIDHGIIQAGFTPNPCAAIQIASISTLYARGVRGTAMEMPAADIIVVDEAHHIRARTYREIIDSYPGAALIGLTATPCRGDGRGLGAVFDRMIEGPTVAELIRLGVLVGTVVYAPSTPDLDGVHIRRGDYVESQLAERMDKPHLVGDIPMHWHRLAKRAPTLLYASSVQHSIHCRDEFRGSGVTAEHIDGTTPIEERDRILRDLAAGNVEVVCNYGVLTEGFDCPIVGCIILARPTRQIGLYLQMIGRGLRAAPGKTQALILDHSGCTLELGFAEDPIEWTLAADKKAVRPETSGRGDTTMRTLTTCPECSAVRTSGSPCPACGWRPTERGKPVPVIDGELGRLSRGRKVDKPVHDAAVRARWHAMLAYIANERGYRSGWTAHKFKEKFSQWPTARFVTPMTPDAEVRAWVRSRQIAFAKSMDRGNAA